MKKWIILLLALLVFSCAQAEKQPIPDILRFTQRTQTRESVRSRVYIQRTYPVTKNPQVNADMRQVIDSLVESGKPHLPTGSIAKDNSYLRVGASISRTGQSWMSFLTTAHVKHLYEQTHVDFDARVYDMQTGTCLTMDDLFAPDSQGWEVMAQAVRTQLNAYFPQSPCDQAALDALCTRQALQNVPFTLTGGSLRLHYPAEALYPGRHTLMHVRLMYSAIRPHMRQNAQVQTDNSRYKLAALTFDDGPAHIASINVVDTLRRHGADATFFLVGSMLEDGHYVMAYEHDAGYALAYHSYHHKTSGTNLYQRVPGEWEQFCREIREVTGTIPTIMRAPGGFENPFIRARLGLPLINWTVSAGDGTSERSYDEAAIETIARNVGGGARDGAVILMHDLRQPCHLYLEPILNRLEERGFLCVTVEELFDSYGVVLQPDTVYSGAERYVQ